MATPCRRAMHVGSPGSAVPRRFAPLRDGPPPAGVPRLRGIVFDVDGTLW